MAKVHLLNPEVISKIAAGEVIQRPASVVKELLENAIDAGADTIEIHLEDAGKKLIHLKDNGQGIEPDDLETIFLRHSTSKLSSFTDLFQMFSLGFRGEALYSIGAISDVILRSKVKSLDSGWEIHLRGGVKQNLYPCGMAVGTEVQVRELFFNTPARRKFLKSSTTEFTQILDIVIPYSILYPKRRFTLTHNQKLILELKPQNPLERIEQALNLEEKHILYEEKNFPEEKVSIKLFLGDASISRSRKNLQYIFINNRPVSSRLLSYHLNQVYTVLFPVQIYGFFILNLTIPPDTLDVNIHPTKREVKLKDEYYLAQRVRALAESVLISKSAPKEFISGSNDFDSQFQGNNFPGSDGLMLNYVNGQAYPTGHKQRPVPTVSLGENLFNSNLFSISSESNLSSKLTNSKFIGGFLKKYLLFESGTSLLIIDQHAAQERITYEQLLIQVEQGNLEVQNLIAPILFKLSAQEMVVWEIVKETISQLGFTTTLWDKESIALHSQPRLISNLEIAVRNLLSGEERSNLDTESLARRACRNSLMAGYEIDFTQSKYLCQQLLSCANPFTCPHGRPTIIEIKEYILEKQFLRS